MDDRPSAPSLVRLSDTKYHDAVDWGWGSNLEKKDAALRQKQVDLREKELMLIDQERRIKEGSSNKQAG